MATQGLSKLGNVGEGLADGRWSLSPQTYSPEVQAYLKQLDDLAASKGAGYYNSLIPSGSLNNGDVDLPAYATDQYLRQFIGQDPMKNLGYQFDVGGKWGSTGQVSAGSGTNIVLVNDKTGETISAGSGFEAAQAAEAAAKAMGGKAAWSIYAAPEGTSDYYRWGQNEPQQGVVSGLGQLIATVGPVVAGGALAPGGMLGSQGASLGLRAGAAAGIAGTGSAMQGKSVADIAKAAAIAGLGTYGGAKLGELTKGIGGVPSGGLAPYQMDNAVAGLPGIGGAGDWARIISPNSLWDGVGSAVGADIGSGNEIVVNAPRAPVGGIGSIGGAFDSGPLAGGAGDDMITVTGRPQRPTVPTAGIGTVLDDFRYTDDPTPIEVRGPRPLPPEDRAPIVSIPQQPILTTVPPFTTPAPEVPGKSILDRIKDNPIDAIRGVIGLGSVLGGVLGGGGGDDDGGGTGTAGGGTVDIPAAIAAGKRTAIAPTYDPFTYGQADGDQPGEFTFFQSKAEGGPIEEDHADHAERWQAGIGHSGPGPVAGIGGGQDDKIPAWLSADEYVWSAQDVADLGDGSSTEGHKRLDRMRQEVRRRAGRKDVKKIAKPQNVERVLAAGVA